MSNNYDNFVFDSEKLTTGKARREFAACVAYIEEKKSLPYKFI